MLSAQEQELCSVVFLCLISVNIYKIGGAPGDTAIFSFLTGLWPVSCVLRYRNLKKERAAANNTASNSRQQPTNTKGRAAGARVNFPSAPSFITSLLR